MINYNIDNYKDLLHFICNQEEIDFSKSKSIIVVYDILNKGIPKYLFKTAKECGKLFNTTDKVIGNYMCTNKIRDGRYRIERVYF